MQLDARAKRKSLWWKRWAASFFPVWHAGTEAQEIQDFTSWRGKRIGGLVRVDDQEPTPVEKRLSSKSEKQADMFTIGVRTDLYAS